MKRMKNMSKRLLALFIVLMMCLSMVNVTALAAEDGDAEAETQTSEGTVADEGSEVPDGAEDTTPAEDGEEDSAPTEDGEEGSDPAEDGEEDSAPTEDGEGNSDPAEDGEEDSKPAEDGDENSKPAEDGEGNSNPVEDGEENSNPVEDGEENSKPIEDGTENSDPAEGDKADAPADVAPEAPVETVKPEEPPVKEVQPEVVKPSVSPETIAFLAAVAALPAEVTAENAEEVAALMEACQAAYDALSEEDLANEKVVAALVVMAGLMEQVETLAMVFPTEPVAKIGDTEYPMLALAVKKAAPGDTITLVADVTESVTVSQSLTIDLDGHTWTGSNTATLTVSSKADVTVQNGSMKSAGSYNVISASGGTLTLNDITIKDHSNCFHLVKTNGTALVINDGEFSGNRDFKNGGYMPIAVTGGSLMINGTKISGNTAYHLIDVSKAETVSIKNAVISGNTVTATDSFSMGGGGTVRLMNTKQSIEISNTQFTDNHAKDYGGALCVYNPSAGVSLIIEGCAFTGNVSEKTAGAVYVANPGDTIINDTVITGNAANGKPPKVMCFGNYGGGLYVANTTGTITLSGTTKVYNNHTPNDTLVPGGTDGGSADIALYSTKVSSSAFAKDPNNFTRATLVLGCETSFTGEDGNKYTLTQFDRKTVNSNGYYWFSGNNYYWPMGYYTVVEEPMRVYLGTEGQHTGGDKAMMTTTLAEAVKAAQDNEQDTIYVCSKFTVDMASAVSLNSGITFARCAEHGTSGHMFTINGDVTLDSAHIDGMNVQGNASLIYVPSSGHLTITGDTLIENGKNAAPKGDGGAIYVSQGSLTMTGGTIDNCSARQGGGIYAFGGKLVSFEGGTVSNNTATGGNGGGGAYIEATSSEFGVYGGRTLFDGNKTSQLGGGVFLVNGTNANTHHYIYKATFTNNQSTRFMQYFDGGAIYIQSGTTAHMKNVYVSGNRDGDKAGNGYTAVAVCPTGKLALYELDGLLAVNNGKNPDIGVIKAGNIPQVLVYDENGKPVLDENGKQVTKDIEPKVYLSSHAPGGGEVSYTYSDGTTVDLSDYQFVEGYFRLRTSASDSVIDAARETAEDDGVVITGNYASQYGSGIMTNGLLKIGTETTTLRVNKVWADGAEGHENDQILVFLTKDGEIVDQDFRSDSSVILNKDNNWSYTWTDLGDQFTWGVKEASVDGYTSEVKVEKDTEFSAIADKYYIATITNTSSTETSRKLVINKTAYGLDPDASYKFTLKLDNVGDKVFALQVDGTLYPIYNNEITFYLKDQQSAVVEGLPAGFTYEVTEAEGEYLTYDFESGSLDSEGTTTIVDFVNVAKTNVPVVKTWATNDPEGAQPKSITIQLLVGEEVVDTITVTAKDNWSHTFTNLPKYNADGSLVEYKVKEVGADGYDASYEGDSGSWQIVNTLKRGQLTISKDVIGGPDSASSDAVYTFVVTGPYGYNRDDVTITGKGSVVLQNLAPGEYTVTEKAAPIDGYKWTYTVDNDGKVTVTANNNATVTVTNTYTSPDPNTALISLRKDVTGTGATEASKDQTWTFVLTDESVNKVLTAPVEASVKGSGSVSFGEISFTKAGIYTFSVKETTGNAAYWTYDGRTYTVQYEVTWKTDNTLEVTKTTITRRDVGEDGTAVDTVVDAIVFENTYDRPGGGGSTPTYTSLTVNKVWAGDGEVERPASVTVQLYRNGAVYSTITLSAANNWSYTWRNLLDTDTWTVGEIDVPEGYTSSMSKDGTTVTITNTYTPDTPDIPDEDTPRTDIPDEDPPLTDIPEEEPPLTDIPDEEIPLDEAPATGDPRHIALWGVMCVLSLIGTIILGKKKEEDEA